MKPATKQEEKKQQIVKQQAQPLASLDYLNQFGVESGPAEGFEDVRPEDVKVPRIAIAQALSPQLDESSTNYIPGLKKGDFFNTMTHEVYGPVVTIVPLLKFGNRLLFRNMDEGGGILCRSNDMKTGEGEPGGDCRKCPLAKFGSARDGEGKGTACSEFYNFPVLVVKDGVIDTQNPAIWSAKSSHIDAAKNLIGLGLRRRLPNGYKPPMWAGVYTLKSGVKKFGEKLSAYVPTPDNAGYIEQKDIAKVRECFKFMDELAKQNRISAEESQDVADTFVDEPGASDESNA